MPILSRFLGISIKMYYDDHSPPHFHAYYGSFEVAVEIESGVVRGNFPPRALRHLLEWRALRRGDLRVAWHSARLGQHPQPIAGLE